MMLEYLSDFGIHFYSILTLFTDAALVAADDLRLYSFVKVMLAILLLLIPNALFNMRKNDKLFVDALCLHNFYYSLIVDRVFLYFLRINLRFRQVKV
jgi:hypothetical protein